eukprot:Seg4868.1 transcript_id=Seg4868.1/GoldUCD/mRNA.D3Y31 product="INO80 complex subunit C" protein_id=Seg4868.1/GoldUCD/D3Y31
MALPSDSKILQGKTLQEVVELKMKGGILGAGKKRKIAAKNSDLEDSNQTHSPAPMQDSPNPQTCIFKNADFEHSGARGGRKRTWKNLKQVISAERTLSWPENSVTYGSIDAPISFKPGKKYSDISGFHAKYTDPQTKLRYSSSAEFRIVRQLPYDRMQGYLGLRNASFVP